MYLFFHCYLLIICAYVRVISVNRFPKQTRFYLGSTINEESEYKAQENCNNLPIDFNSKNFSFSKKTTRSTVSSLPVRIAFDTCFYPILIVLKDSVHINFAGNLKDRDLTSKTHSINRNRYHKINRYRDTDILS